MRVSAVLSGSWIFLYDDFRVAYIYKPREKIPEQTARKDMFL